MIGLAVLLVIAVMMIYNLAKKLADKPELEFGVYWDSKNNPLCPKERHPLGPFDNQASPGTSVDDYKYSCSSCPGGHRLQKSDGTELTDEQARALRNRK